MKKEKIIIFDTTLRDGEQCPGASMTVREKLEVARQLARLKVDVIEAGFPIASEGDFEAVRLIASQIKGPKIAGLARCIPADIDRAAEALKPAGDRARIHVFLATSKIHREYKLRKAQEEILRLAVEGVRRARSYVQDVEFSPEDASRTEPEFLIEVCKAVIEAGATTVNIPDTVGWAVPEEFGELIRKLYEGVPEFQSGKAIISVHCHNDLGLAVANSLAAIRAGARQVECTVNGIGERAGNAALEEIVMAIKTRNDFFKGLYTGINTRQIVKTSRLVSRMTGLIVQRNKAIVGDNAFAHSSGIHQDGILKKRETYEIMDPKEVGWGETELPLTKHSGRAAVAARLGQITQIREIWQLDYLSVSTGINMIPTATVRLKKINGDNGETQIFQDASIGDGPVDATLKAIDRITKTHGRLKEFSLRAVSQGKDALGEVTISVEFGKGQVVSGKGTSTDIIEASARAYLNALNRYLARPKESEEARELACTNIQT